MRQPGVCVRAFSVLVMAMLSLESVASDDALYYACQSCHEHDGSGNEAIGAPAIAGMDADYVAAQMRKFRDGIRGASINDLPGRQMNLIASLITDDDEIEKISNFVAAMTRHAPQRTIDVTVASAAGLFARCTACHGNDGAGNRNLGAPAIAGLDDWYIRSQLTRFRDGNRGAHPDDGTGAQMKAAVVGLSDEDILVLSAFAAAMNQE